MNEQILAALMELGAQQIRLLETIKFVLERIADQDLKLRDVQSQNAERAAAFVNDQSFTDTAFVRARDVYPALNTNIYSSMMVSVGPLSGTARWLMDGPDPTPTVGVQVAAGGDSFIVRGANNIRNFSIIAEAGQAGTVTFYLFK